MKKGKQKNKPLQDMLTIEECRAKLENNGEEYTNEQIINIRDSVYELALIAFEVYKNIETKKR